MIPKFPIFKSLELEDKSEYDQYVMNYDPYSDFNFVNTWCWGAEWDPKISFLNKNLVFLWDYKHSDIPIFSFLGSNNPTFTCDSIFTYIEGLPHKKGKISYVPEISLSGIKFDNYYIEIDIDSCDYVYDIHSISTMRGNQLSQKRGRVNHFLSAYPTVETRMLDLYDPVVKKEILELNQRWKDLKGSVDGFYENEDIALTRFFDSGFDKIMSIGIYDSRLIAYAIFSAHTDSYAINHFIKGDLKYKGLYEFVMRESASFLSSQGYRYVNHMEDLGISGLRQAKMSYRPVKFLRKYHIKRL